jgi:hypothetical protein
MKTMSTSFLVEPQNQGQCFCQWFGIKTIETISLGLASKSVTTISPGFTSKSVVISFPVCASKPTATI